MTNYNLKKGDRLRMMCNDGVALYYGEEVICQEDIETKVGFSDVLIEKDNGQTGRIIIGCLEKISKEEK